MIIPTLVRDFTCSVKTGDDWRGIARVTDNHQRRSTLHFDAVQADAVRIKVTATWGDPSARIYEVGVYG